jgi:phosphomannomutase
MTQPRLVAFDLDDTLAPSKAPLEQPMVDALLALLDTTPVCVISGGQIAQFTNQVVNRLSGASPAQLGRLHLMPTCGTQYYRHVEGTWQQVYAHNLTDDEKARALQAVESAARRLGLWEADTWGPILEDRGSQITFSALGQHAPVDAKRKWDPTGEKKDRLREAVAAVLPDLEVRSGGSTSVDITRRGIDKAYGINRLSQLTDIPLAEMLFIGDRLDEAGNDYPVKALGVPCIEVSEWRETVGVVSELARGGVPATGRPA